MQILKVLSVIGRVESSVGQLYRRFSEVFADDEEASGLFFRMSMQERSHANLVSYCKKLTHRSPAEFAEVDVDISEVEELLDEISHFSRQKRRPTLAHALDFAMKIEDHAAENIHKSIVIQSNPAVAAIINNLAAADEEHFKELHDFAVKRGLASSESQPA